MFSCFNQDQPLDQVDFAALAQRLAQNGVQEKLTALWIGRCLKLLPPPRQKGIVDLMGKLEWDESFDYKRERSRR